MVSGGRTIATTPAALGLCVFWINVWTLEKTTTHNLILRTRPQVTKRWWKEFVVTVSRELCSWSRVRYCRVSLLDYIMDVPVQPGVSILDFSQYVNRTGGVISTKHIWSKNKLRRISHRLCRIQETRQVDIFNSKFVPEILRLYYNNGPTKKRGPRWPCNIATTPDALGLRVFWTSMWTLKKTTTRNLVRRVRSLVTRRCWQAFEVTVTREWFSWWRVRCYRSFSEHLMDVLGQPGVSLPVSLSMSVEQRA